MLEGYGIATYHGDARHKHVHDVDPKKLDPGPDDSLDAALAAAIVAAGR